MEKQMFKPRIETIFNPFTSKVEEEAD